MKKETYELIEKYMLSCMEDSENDNYLSYVLIRKKA